jgi:hypothetical protein
MSEAELIVEDSALAVAAHGVVASEPVDLLLVCSPKSPAICTPRLEETLMFVSEPELDSSGSRATVGILIYVGAPLARGATVRTATLIHGVVGVRRLPNGLWVADGNDMGPWAQTINISGGQ